MHVLIAVSTDDLTHYADATRLLRRALGDDAPDLPTLMAMELRHRKPRSIAEEYLESHGYPTLRDCCRARAKEARARRKNTGATARPRPSKAAIGIVRDPSRN